jgi:hypothetical protein
MLQEQKLKLFQKHEDTLKVDEEISSKIVEVDM